MNTNPYVYNPRVQGDIGISRSWGHGAEPDLGRPNRWDVWDILVQGYHAPIGEEADLEPEPREEDLSLLRAERPSAISGKERLAAKKALRDAIRAERFVLVEPSEQPVQLATMAFIQPRRGRGRPKGSKDTKPRKPRKPETKPRKRCLPYLEATPEQRRVTMRSQRHGAQGEPATAR
jgi:hypothetical protein